MLEHAQVQQMICVLRPSGFNQKNGLRQASTCSVWSCRSALAHLYTRTSRSRRHNLKKKPEGGRERDDIVHPLRSRPFWEATQAGDSPQDTTSAAYMIPYPFSNQGFIEETALQGYECMR